MEDELERGNSMDVYVIMRCFKIAQIYVKQGRGDDAADGLTPLSYPRLPISSYPIPSATFYPSS